MTESLPLRKIRKQYTQMMRTLEPEEQGLLNHTYKLASQLRDVGALNKIKQIRNEGKRIQMGVSSTLILDTIDTFCEYKEIISNSGFDTRKSSVVLLTRYLFELYVNFLYIFQSGKGKAQVRSKAFFYYGDYAKNKLQGKPNASLANLDWLRFVPSNQKKNNWHGKTFAELCDDVRYTKMAYNFLSQFTHPTIFGMEKILNTAMFSGVVEDAIPFTTSQVCDVIKIGYERKLYGIKQGGNSEREIAKVLQLHDEYMRQQKKSRDRSS